MATLAWAILRRPRCIEAHSTLDTHEVALGGLLGLLHEKFPVAKADFQLQQRLTAKTTVPINRMFGLLPENKWLKGEITCLHLIPSAAESRA